MVKGLALHVCRHLEHTVLLGVVTQFLEQLSSGIDLFTERFLINARDVTIDGPPFRRSRHAVVRIGEISCGDLVMARGGDVGKVLNNWQTIPSLNDEVIVEIETYASIDRQVTIQSMSRNKRVFVDSEFVSTLFWIMESPAIIRVSIPPSIVYSSCADAESLLCTNGPSSKGNECARQSHVNI